MNILVKSTVYKQFEIARDCPVPLMNTAKPQNDSCSKFIDKLKCKMQLCSIKKWNGVNLLNIILDLKLMSALLTIQMYATENHGTFLPSPI